MKHIPYICDGSSHGSGEVVYCNYCDGGLFTCKVCNCSEGSLPTDCPGMKIDFETQVKIFNKELDFVNGKWVEINKTLHCKPEAQCP